MHLVLSKAQSLEYYWTWMTPSSRESWLRCPKQKFSNAKPSRARHQLRIYLALLLFLPAKEMLQGTELLLAAHSIPNILSFFLNALFGTSKIKFSAETVDTGLNYWLQKLFYFDLSAQWYIQHSYKVFWCGAIQNMNFDHLKCFHHLQSNIFSIHSCGNTMSSFINLTRIWQLRFYICRDDEVLAQRSSIISDILITSKEESVRELWSKYYRAAFLDSVVT